MEIIVELASRGMEILNLVEAEKAVGNVGLDKNVGRCELE